MTWRLRGPLGALVRAVIGLAVASALTATALIADGMRDDARTSDVAIVMGTKVLANCQPNPPLKARLKKTVDLYKAGKFPKIIVTGGKTNEDLGQNEAACMHAYLVSQGVPSQVIFDDRGGDTIAHTAEAAHNSAKIMHEQGFRSALIITHYYHVPRTQLALYRCGVTDVSRAPVGHLNWDHAWQIAREIGGYPAYLFGYRYSEGDLSVRVLPAREINIGRGVPNPAENCPEHGDFMLRPNDKTPDLVTVDR